MLVPQQPCGQEANTCEPSLECAQFMGIRTNNNNLAWIASVLVVLCAKTDVTYLIWEEENYFCFY